MVSRKVSIFGAGFVGSTTAQSIVQQDLADVMLIDPQDGVAEGKALDLMQSSSLMGFTATVSGSTAPTACADSDVVVITGGIARKPGMSRDDLLTTNARIVGTICSAVREYASKAVVIVVTNPLDAMTYHAYMQLGFPAHRVMGMAGMLDSARLCYFLAKEARVSVRSVNAMVLGGHGDDMLPLIRHASIAGVPVQEMLSHDRLEAIVARTRQSGAEIVNLLKTGSAFYAPGVASAAMVRAVLNDEQCLVPAAVWCTGEYEIDRMFVGLPAILGRHGVERIVELPLTPEETSQLQCSARHVRETMERLGLTNCAEPIYV